MKIGADKLIPVRKFINIQSGGHKMNSESLNEMHAEIRRAELACTELGEQLDEHDKLGRELESKLSEQWTIWDQRVIAIGAAIAETRKQYGVGWKRDFKTLGYDFSYVTACRYVSCARHPEASEEASSVEEWATAAAEIDRAASRETSKREADRKQRAADRNGKRTDAISHACSTAAAPASEAQQRASHDRDEARVSAAFRSIDHAIECFERYQGLRDNWHILATAIRRKVAYLKDTVSPFVDDDTVDLGEGQPIEEECIEPLILDYTEA